MMSGEHLLFREITSTNAVSLWRLQINPARLGSPHPERAPPVVPTVVPGLDCMYMVAALLPLFSLGVPSQLAKREAFVHLVPSPGRCLSSAQEHCLGRTTDSHRATAHGNSNLVGLNTPTEEPKAAYYLQEHMAWWGRGCS